MRISDWSSDVCSSDLFACIRDQFPRWVLLPMVTLASIGNIIEAAADLGGIGAALNLLVPIPIPNLVLGTSAIIFGIQYVGRSEELRVGQERDSTCRSRWWPYHL